MVVGLERWKEYFKEYEDKYVLIGGAACNIWEEEVNINPRATKDLDVVLIVEALTVDFGKRLWDFIKDAKAFVEMLEREKNLGNVDSRDIEKHKKDIFRLLAMLPQQSHFDLPNKIRLDIEEFYNKVGELPNSDFFKSSRLIDLNATKLLKILQTAFL